MSEQLQNEWKSPRQIEQELKAYRNSRFEYWMKRVDNGELTEEEAMLACKEELGE